MSVFELTNLIEKEAWTDMAAEVNGVRAQQGTMQKDYPEEYRLARESFSLMGGFISAAHLSFKHAGELSAMLHSEDEGLNSIQEMLNKQPANAMTLARLISLEREREPGKIEILTQSYFSENGKTGAEKRWAPMRELEKWTVDLYKIGSWPSANKAAHDLREKVIAHGRTIGAVLSDENAQRTIAAWINEHLKGV